MIAALDDRQGVVVAVFKFIVRRVLWSIPVLLLVIFLTFLLMKAIPGGPVHRVTSMCPPRSWRT